MTAVAPIPEPLDDDDGDVAWNLQTASVQWGRGSYADAIVWLQRAVDAAIDVGASDRAAEINRVAAKLAEQVPDEPAPAVSGADDVDALLDAKPEAEPSPPRESSMSIDVEVEPEPVSDVAADNPFLQRGDGGTGQEKIDTVRPPSSAPGPDVEPASVVPPPPRPPPPPRRRPPPAPSTRKAAPPVAETPEEPAEAAPASTPAEVPAVDAPEAPVEEAQTDQAAAPAAPVEEAPVAEALAPEAPAEAPPSEEASDEEPSVGGVSLMDVQGLQDLPEEAHAELARAAKIEELNLDEEVGNFEVALVVGGWVSVMPTIADFAAAVAREGDVVFTTGTIDESIALKVVAGEDGTRVAVWQREMLEQAIADCPWVEDELAEVADRFQALAGATMGPLGDRLDDSLRAMVTDRMNVRSHPPGDVVVEAGKPVPGMFIVGAGRLELVEADGDEVADELASGDFLFADQVLAQGPAPMTARAAEGGVVLLFCERKVAHEVMVTVPPLLEILSS